MFNEFPKMLYHRTERARIVQDPGEQETAIAIGFVEDRSVLDAPPEPEAAPQGEPPTDAASDPPTPEPSRRRKRAEGQE